MSNIPMPTVQQELDGTYLIHFQVYRQKKWQAQIFRTPDADRAAIKFADARSRWLIQQLHNFIIQQEFLLQRDHKHNPAFRTRIVATGRLNSLLATMAAFPEISPYWLAVEIRERIGILWNDAKPGPKSTFAKNVERLEIAMRIFYQEFSKPQPIHDAISS